MISRSGGESRVSADFTDATRGQFEVEPATNYFAARAAKDLSGGATQIKAMASSVYRDLGDPYLQSRLSHHSEAFGVSSDSWWGKRTYRLMAQLAGTHVEGDTTAMRRIRFGSAHFFQRPDRPDTADATHHNARRCVISATTGGTRPHNAIAAITCPLGNEGPPLLTSAPSDGRTRPTPDLISHSHAGRASVARMSSPAIGAHTRHASARSTIKPITTTCQLPSRVT